MKHKKVKDVQSYYDLIAALRQRGAVVNRVGFTSNPYFQIGGMVLKINNSKLQVFEYSNPDAQRMDFNGLLSKDAARISTKINDFLK